MLVREWRSWCFQFQLDSRDLTTLSSCCKSTKLRSGLGIEFSVKAAQPPSTSDEVDTATPGTRRPSLRTTGVQIHRRHWPKWQKGWQNMRPRLYKHSILWLSRQNGHTIQPTTAAFDFMRYRLRVHRPVRLPILLPAVHDSLYLQSLPNPVNR